MFHKGVVGWVWFRIRLDKRCDRQVSFVTFCQEIGLLESNTKYKNIRAKPRIVLCKINLIIRNLWMDLWASTLFYNLTNFSRFFFLFSSLFEWTFSSGYFSLRIDVAASIFLNRRFLATFLIFFTLIRRSRFCWWSTYLTWFRLEEIDKIIQVDLEFRQ